MLFRSRASSPEELGRNIVVQGGTFYNEAVLRAFEKEMGVFQCGMSAFNDFLYLFALVFGSLLCYFGIITAADLTAYILYINMLLSPLRTLIAMFEQIDEGATGFRRFCDLMDTPSEYEPEHPVKADLNGDVC